MITVPAKARPSFIRRVREAVAPDAVECDIEGMDPTFLFVSMFVGTVGMAMLVFGKKAGKLVPLGCGAGLMLTSYVAPGVPSMLVASTLIAAVPFVVKS